MFFTITTSQLLAKQFLKVLSRDRVFVDFVKLKKQKRAIASMKQSPSFKQTINQKLF